MPDGHLDPYKGMKSNRMITMHVTIKRKNPHFQVSFKFCSFLAMAKYLQCIVEFITYRERKL